MSFSCQMKLELQEIDAYLDLIPNPEIISLQDYRMLLFFIILAHVLETKNECIYLIIMLYCLQQV